MPRPCKRRRVCAMPGCGRFGPVPPEAEERPAVLMTVDEFETIRLIDLEGMTQEQCAVRMNVARTTVQAIYNSARFKLAASLVNGRELSIGGGEFDLCPGSAAGCGCPRCPRDAAPASAHFEQNLEGGNQSMKIAVTYENGQVYQHFGHSQQFKVYEAADGKVLSSAVVDTEGSGHGALAGFLTRLGVDAVICGGIGGGAQTALAQAGIRLYGGVSGSADAAAEALLSGSLRYDPDVMCSHHGEHDGHHGEHGSCGEHGCGRGSCEHK